IRLKEGESNIIAGLIRDEERQSMRGIPLLAKVPFLGKLFAANETEVKETDVIITLSPHILRGIGVKPGDEDMIWLGIDTQQQQSGTFRPYTPYVPPPPVQPNVEHPQKTPTEEEQTQEEDQSDEENPD